MFQQIYSDLSNVKYLPDYENAIQTFGSDITSSNNYTAPKDGVFYVRWVVTNSSSSTCKAFVNEVQVGETTSSGWNVIAFPMKQNDVCKFVLQNAKISSTSMFVPYK